MVSFTTSSGKVTVNNWGYELQGTNGNPLDAGLLISATHDFLVIDSTRDGTNAERDKDVEPRKHHPVTIRTPSAVVKSLALNYVTMLRN